MNLFYTLALVLLVADCGTIPKDKPDAPPAAEMICYTADENTQIKRAIQSGLLHNLELEEQLRRAQQRKISLDGLKGYCL